MGAAGLGCRIAIFRGVEKALDDTLKTARIRTTPSVSRWKKYDDRKNYESKKSS
jgi:hypothetical protein